MKIFYAAIKERYSRDGYRAHEFTVCESKAEVREFCKQNGYVISGNKVYTEKEWKED